MKSVESLAPVHSKQVLTYLKLTDSKTWTFNKFQREFNQRWYS
ncbi:MAG: GxxExxY protein [Paludibacter sp.]